jgi:FixJ family two-component response regulator
MVEGASKPTVIVVDDDPETPAAISRILEPVGMRVDAFRCAEEFLSQPFVHDAPKCLILEVRMRGLGGLELQQRLLQDGVRIPIIFLTGFGDVPSAVQAIRSGGFDFLEKPLQRDWLLERIAQALDHDAQLLRVDNEVSAVEKRISSLSPREHEVFDLLLEGKSNKEIAQILYIGMPTVTKHRSKVLQKLRVRNAFELVAVATHSRNDQNGSPRTPRSRTSSSLSAEAANTAK